MNNWMNRVKQSRAALMSVSPIISFFAEELILQSTDDIPGTGIETAGVSRSGITVFHKPYVEGLDDRELMFLLAHEALHWGLSIFDRAKSLDFKIANIAHDHVVNLLLSTEKAMKAPEGILCNHMFENLSFEQVYIRVEEDQNTISSRTTSENKRNSLQPSDIDFSDQIDALYADAAEVPLRDLQTDAIRRLGEAVNKAAAESLKSNNRVWSSVLDEYCQKFRVAGHGEVPVQLMDILPLFIGRYGRHDRPSKKRRNRRNRFDGSHIPYAGMRPSRSILYLLIDTSGSMVRLAPLYQKLFGLILRLVRENQMELVIVESDTEVRKVTDGRAYLEQIISGEVTLSGKGGSDFRPAFEFLIHHASIHNDQKLPLLAVTDGYIEVPEKVSGVMLDLLWVGNHHSKAPTKNYGKHVIIE